jgi:putative ABC transport system permease protein
MRSRPSRSRATSADDRGGVPARRAVVRWVWRMFRREWRQQVLVLTMLTVAVAGAIGCATAAYNLAPVPANAELGTANFSLVFADPDPAVLRRTLARGEQWFDAVDAIGHRAVPIPGSDDTVDHRVQDPDGPYGSPMLDLRDGRYPATNDEVAVTDWVAETFDADIGASLAIDGTARTVVGVVENPSDLDDEFALLDPSAIGSSESLTMLVDTSEERVVSFLPGPDGDGTEAPINVGITERAEVPEDVLAALMVLVVATVALFLVSLVAAASFVVVAQRRLRQLGMLAAIGATEKHVRLVMVATGAVAGAVAAVLGTILGVAGWVVLAPRVEEAAGYRIDAFDVPWWLVLAGMLLAVVTAAGAAWWPARTMARIPPVLALSGRPPRPLPIHRSAALAGAFIVGGVACLSLAGDVVDTTGDSELIWTNALLVVAGTLAVIVGVLLVSPLAIRLLARAAARLPVAVRLALRDLGRHQARSGAALAAISLALGIPVAIVVTAAAAEHSADTGNLSDRQLLVQAREDPEPEPSYLPEAAELAGLQAGVDRLAASLDDPTVISLDVPLDPNASVDPGDEGRLPVELGEPMSDGLRFVSSLYVATPALLDHYGVDLDAVDTSTEFLTVETGKLAIITPDTRGDDRSEPENPARPRPPGPNVTNTLTLTPTYSSFPGSFVTLDALRRRGWEVTPSGQWLVETSEPLTSEELATARDVAAGAGLTIESRDQQTGLQTLRSGATAVGMLLALGILAMTIGLIRSQSASDVRTLTATGASGATRRTLTAATAGGLAVLGVALGTACAYLTLVAGFRGDIGDLTPVPVTHLAMIAAGTPLAAAAAGWLLAGREPRVIARQLID